MKTFKVKISGMKYTARFVNGDEVINDRMVYAYDFYASSEYVRDNISQYKLWPTKSVGELVSDHCPEHRVYLEILSSYYKTYADPND